MINNLFLYLLNFHYLKSKAKAKTGSAKYQWNIMRSLGMKDEEIRDFVDTGYWLSYFPPLARSDLEVSDRKAWPIYLDWFRFFTWIGISKLILLVYKYIRVLILISRWESAWTGGARSSRRREPLLRLVRSLAVDASARARPCALREALHDLLAARRPAVYGPRPHLRRDGRPAGVQPHQTRAASAVSHVTRQSQGYLTDHLYVL